MNKLSTQGAIRVAKAYLFHVVETQDGINRFEGFKAVFDDGEHQLVLRMAVTEHYPAVESVVLSGWNSFEDIIPHLDAVYPVYEIDKKPSGLSHGQEIMIAKACEDVFERIKHTFTEVSDTTTAEQVIVLGVSRLKTYGYLDEKDWWGRIELNLGIKEALKRITARTSFDVYKTS